MADARHHDSFATITAEHKARMSPEEREALHTRRLVGPTDGNFQEIDSLRTLLDDESGGDPDVELMEKMVYFTRLVKGQSARPTDDKEGTVLDNILAAGGLCVL